MQQRHGRKLDFEVDKLTNSIEDARTGEKIETHVVRLGVDDLNQVCNLGWDFDWGLELSFPNRKVYALITEADRRTFQGLVSLEERQGHLYMHLLESSPSNRGQKKQYVGVPGNLVAFLCKRSIEMGNDGSIAFVPKTRLIEHYEKTLGAKRITRTLMFIQAKAAKRLVNQYFPDFNYDRP